MLPKLTVLFLCTGNACRSQMAEGWTRALHHPDIEAFSAGTDPAGLDDRAVRVMAEKGVDISGQRSKHLDELSGRTFDCVITVCDRADERCPVFPRRTRRIHAGFDDPPRLASGARTEKEALVPYRNVRDAIHAFVETLPRTLRPSDDGDGPP